MKKSMAGIVVAMLCLALSPGANAQSQQSLNLTPLKTAIRTQNDNVHLTNSPVQIFADTKITCPKTATKGCTLGIVVGGQYQVYESGYGLYVVVQVSGANLPPVDPNSSEQMVANGAGGVATFDWMQRGVPAGATVTVNVQAEVSDSGHGDVYDRTETVTVFKN